MNLSAVPNKNEHKTNWTKKGSGLLAETREDGSVVDKLVAGSTCRGGVGSVFMKLVEELRPYMSVVRGSFVTCDRPFFSREM